MTIRTFDMKREIAESEKLAQIIANALQSAGGSATNNASAGSQGKSAK